MTNPTVDPVMAVWETLTSRGRTVVELRLSGVTFDHIGTTIGVTRERARQIHSHAQEALLSALDKYLPDLRAELARILDDYSAVAESELHASLGTAPSLPMSAVLRALGVARPRTWAGDLVGWWTLRPGSLDVQLRIWRPKLPSPKTS